MKNSVKIYNSNSTYFKAIDLLEKNNIRVTSQRKILTKLIFDYGDRHLSA